MRKVMVSEYVKQFNPTKWVTQEKGEAIFHQFGSSYEEFETGPGNYTTAVIEWPDGVVENVPVHLVRFLDAPVTSQTEIDRAALVKRMVDRFLMWKLPENFNPDGGITFSKVYFGYGGHPRRRAPSDPFWPIGTNLFDADQAKEMIEHMLAEGSDV